MTRAFAVILLAAIGCGGNESPGQRLELAVNTFNQSIRWGNIGAAADFIATEKRADWVKRRRRLEDTVVILDFEIIEVRHPDMQAIEAEVTVAWEWRGKNSNLVERGKFVQTWKYRENDKTWVMDKQAELKLDDPVDDSPFEEPGALD